MVSVEVVDAVDFAEVVAQWWLVALALLVACVACLVNVRLEAGQRYSPLEASARPNRLFQGNAGTVPAIGGF